MSFQKDYMHNNGDRFHPPQPQQHQQHQDYIGTLFGPATSAQPTKYREDEDHIMTAQGSVEFQLMGANPNFAAGDSIDIDNTHGYTHVDPSINFHQPHLIPTSTPHTPAGDQLSRKPLKLAADFHNDDKAYYVARFPRSLDVCSLPKPVTISRDVQEEEEEDVEEGSNRRNSTRWTESSVTWRIVDGRRREFVGRKDGLDTHSYFGCINKGSHYEVIPLDGWYTFTHEIGTAVVSRQSVNLEERKLRAVQRGVAPKNKAKTSDEEAPSDPFKRALVTPQQQVDELGLKKRERKRRKKLQMQKRSNIRETKDEDRVSSALNLGVVQKAKVDWDFDGDCMSDDEDTALDSDNDNQNADGEENSDFGDSDAEQEDLPIFGQKMSQLLENQREKEADEELADISDDDLDDDDALIDSDDKITPQPHGDNMSSLPQTIISADTIGCTSASASPSLSFNPYLSTPPSTQIFSVPTDISPPLPLPSQSSNVHGLVLSVPSAHRTAAANNVPSGAVVGAVGGNVYSKSNNPDPASARGDSQETQKLELKESIKRQFNLHSGRMTPMQLMMTLNIKTKGHRFQWLKDLMSEMCIIDSSNPKARVLELKEMFRVS